MDSFGNYFILKDFGGTHDEKMGGEVIGCPKGLLIDFSFINDELQRRAPSHDTLSTQRRESDQVQFHSGILEGITTGEPIQFTIENKDVKVLTKNLNVLKPSHASYTYKMRYGCSDNSQTGRASARQTACRVVAGAIAKLYLKTFGITFRSQFEIPRLERESLDLTDSYGAVVHTTIIGVPAGIGDPIYNKLSARLAFSMLSINAAKAFSIGEGFAAAQMKGSEYNDLQNPDFTFQSNHDGGIQAGISNGEDILFSVAFKPIPTIEREQKTITFDGQPAIYKGNKRNDKCVAPRVVPVVEAMAALVLADYFVTR